MCRTKFVSSQQIQNRKPQIANYLGLLSSIFGSGKLTENNKFEILRDDGVRAMQMGEFQYAEKCFTAALELQSDLKTTGFLAEVYLHMQNYNAALPLLEKLVNSEANTYELSLLLAQTQGELLLFADERNTCRDLLNKQTNEPRALYLAAEADHGLDDNLTAIVHLTQCLSAEPNFLRAMQLRANILSDMGQWKEACDDADALVEKQPENEEYLLLQANCQQALGNHDDAINTLEKVRALNPFSQEAVIKLGAIYETTTRWDKALALYDEAIELQPDFALAYKARGGVKHHLKDDAGAAADLKRMLELAPEKASELEGTYTNVENEMQKYYRNMNPYGF